MSDKEIIKNLQSGNESCIKALYQYLPLVESWLLRNNGSKEDALDLFQEAIIVFYKKVTSDNYNRTSKISTYLMAICKYQWFNILRKKQKHGFTHIIPEKVADDDLGDFKWNELELELPTRAAYLSEIFEKLGERCKTILEAAIFLNLKMEVIANKYGLASAHSARQQKLRCLKKLRANVSYEYVMSLK